MSEDHLSNETSISAELTQTGVKAAAKSRAVSSFDRLIGSLADAGSAWFEGIAQRRRAKTDGETRIIEATVKYGLSTINTEDEFARRAFEGLFSKVARQQLNKEEVVAEAVEDLRNKPPSDGECSAGPFVINDEFMDAFERYAETASTEELRKRWGRVLSEEIRKPGTFSAKVLRATSELDSDTAKLFESLMRYRTGSYLVSCIMSDLQYSDRLRLIDAGLLADPGIGGQNLSFGDGLGPNGEFWAMPFGNIAVCFPKSLSFSNISNAILGMRDARPVFGVLILTEAGRALSSILDSYEEQIGIEYAHKLQTVLPSAEIFLIETISDDELRIRPVPPA